jgi:amino acid transporter
MTQGVSQDPSTRRAGSEPGGWGVGWTVFAAVMMIMAGIWQGLAGLIAIFENEFYVATRDYLFQFDATTWGWIHLVVGVVVGWLGWGYWPGRPGPGWSGSPWQC